MTDSTFWRFSLQFYALPDVAAACIELQDRYGADVNVLLFLLFLAKARRTLNSADVARIDAAVRAWREEIVSPLRRVRRGLRIPGDSVDRSAAEVLRTNLKRIELEAERIQQETLERLIPAGTVGAAAPSSSVAARANLVAYVVMLGEPPDELLAPLREAFDAIDGVTDD